MIAPASSTVYNIDVLAQRSSMQYRSLMTGFFIRKAFFDGWDNLYLLAGCNAIFLAVGILAFLVPSALGVPVWVAMVLAAGGILILSVYGIMLAYLMYAIAEGKPAHFADLLSHVKVSVQPGLLLGFMNILLLLAASVGIPFYFSLPGLLGAFAGGLLFWSMIIALLILQYVPSFIVREGKGMGHALKRSLFLFLDNPGFSIFVLVWRAGSLMLSGFTMLLAPGPAGVVLASACAVYLRMKQYEYLREHPESDRRHVPWDELLAEERERIGKRTLKGMIFPWKE